MLAEATKRLLAGEVIAFPTETFFGLAADPRSSAAIRKLVELKNRDLGAGISLIIDSPERVEEFILSSRQPQDVGAGLCPSPLDIVERRIELQRNFWPGPLTIIISPNEQAKKTLMPEIFAADGSLALRHSGLKLARDLAASVGGAITATSANPKGQDPARTAKEVLSYFPEIYLASSEISASVLPSTILDVREFPFEILREGLIKKDDIDLVFS